MKKVVCCLLLLLITIVSARAEDWVEVRTADEFVAALTAENQKDIKLKADIDMSGLNVEKMTHEITVFEHRITGLKERHLQGDNYAYYRILNLENPLFSQVNYLTMDHLQFENSSSAVFGWSIECNINEIIFQSCKVIGNHRALLSDQDKKSDLCHISFFSCNLYYEDELPAGFVVGSKEMGTLQGCIVTASCNIYSKDGKVGGIAGRTYQTDISQCSVYGAVMGHDNYCGGIVGYFNNSGANKQITDCEFAGLVKQQNFESYSAFSNWVTSRINLSQNEHLGANITTLSLLFTIGMDIYGGLSIKSNVKGFFVTKYSASSVFAEMDWWFRAQSLGSCGYKAVTGLRDENPFVYLDSFVKFMVFMVNLTSFASGASAVSYALGLAATAYSWITTASGADIVGGIAGYGNNVSILRCMNYGMVFCEDSYCGGIIGQGESAQIYSCLNHGVVHAGENTGGIAGELDSNGKIEYCMNLGNVACTDQESGGRICGNSKGAAMSYNCVSDSVSDLTSQEKRELRISQQDIVSGRAACFLNSVSNDTVWHQDIGKDHWPLLMTSHHCPLPEDIDTDLPTLVEAGDKMSLYYALVNPYSDISLTADIDFEGDPVYNLSSEFMPFCGTIEGNNHKISNITYSHVGKTYSFAGAECLWQNEKNVGLLGMARGARFRNLTLCNVRIFNSFNVENEGLFVGKSEDCVYENVSIVHSSIGESSEKKSDSYAECVGGVIGYSKNDQITNCFVGPDCSIYSYGARILHNANVGGIVGYAEGAKITDCRNAASVMSKDEAVGGIVGYAESSTITSCWNSAAVKSEDNFVGGIVGFANDTKVKSCYFNGTISGIESTGGLIGHMEGNSELSNSVSDTSIKAPIVSTYYNVIYAHAAGLVGILRGNSKISRCILLGSLFAPWCNNDNPYVTESKDAVIECIAYLSFNNKKVNNTYSECPSSVASSLTKEMIASGELAYKLNETPDFGEWYQSIDNHMIDVGYPVPLAFAGYVEHCYDCQTGKLKYSNRYHMGTGAEQGHETQKNEFGLCSKCGAIVGSPNPCISITNKGLMHDFAYAVNNGQDFTSTLVQLNAYIDMEGYCAPIGNAAHPFHGKFNGNGYSIRNMIIDCQNDGGVGLFGTVDGTTIIQEVVVDRSCAIISSKDKVGGIVGSFIGEELSLIKCCNEADVYGNQHVGGIVGSMLPTTPPASEIKSCFNYGNVRGSNYAAGICGDSNVHVDVTNTCNAGKVSGYAVGMPFVAYTDDAFYPSIYHYCFNLDVAQGNVAPPITAADVTSGKVAFLLNGKENGKGGEDAWTQNIGKEDHPHHYGNNHVYLYEVSKCVTPNVIDSLFGNTPESSLPRFIHEFNDDGFCYAARGETHGEVPPVVNGAWQITRPCHLYGVAEQVNNGLAQYDIKLMNDIADNADNGSEHSWTPIGNAEHPFTKTFNGDYHTISGLVGYNQSYLGLIGYMGRRGTVKNLGLVDFTFLGSSSSESYTGAIAGYVKYEDEYNPPRIINCFADGRIDAYRFAGGLVGSYIHQAKQNWPLIQHCLSTSKIYDWNARDNEHSQFIGSLVGHMGGWTDETGIIEDSYYLDQKINPVKTSGLPQSNYGTPRPYNDFRFGTLCQEMGEGWAQNLETDTHPVFGKTGVTYSRPVNEHSWGTLMVPFALTSSWEVQYYTCSYLDDGNTLHLQPVDEVPANTPCFFQTAVNITKVEISVSNGDIVEPESLTVTQAIEPTQARGFSLIGSYQLYNYIFPASGFTNYYVAQNHLWCGDTKFSLPAYRAYLQVPKSGSKAARIAIYADDEAAQIGEINADGHVNFSDTPIYNMYGQRQSSLQPGQVNIVGGQKVLVR